MVGISHPETLRDPGLEEPEPNRTLPVAPWAGEGETSLVGSTDDQSSCCFDDWAVHNARRARSKETVAPVTRALLGALEAVGLEGRTILDVGCGAGDLALAALRHGAVEATGIDLGGGAIAQARQLAEARGLADSSRFEVGDGAIAPLEGADVVVLNRVVCCYPNVDALMANTLAATKSVFAFSAPVDRGAAGLLNRVVVKVSNGWYALRRSKFRGFRTFVHNLDQIDERVRGAGFVLIQRDRRRVVWECAIYERR
jgi:SAM-dependent methyltransferase